MKSILLSRGVVVQHIDIPRGNDSDHRFVSSRISQVGLINHVIALGNAECKIHMANCHWQMLISKQSAW